MKFKIGDGADMKKQHNKLAWVALSLAPVVLSAPAHSETLRIDGLYPARAKNVATIESISIERFGGSDGTDLSFEIEDQLSGLEIGGVPYFRVIAARSAIAPDATMAGTATASVEEFKVKEYRDICIERNDKDKCEKRESREVTCLKRIIDFRARYRMSRYSDGQNIYSQSKSDSHEQSVCLRDESFSSQEKIIQNMIGKMAQNVRFDLAPVERSQSIRVLESRKDMDKDTAKLFKAAVKMTKKDEREACRMWDSTAENKAPHQSLLFNQGLCAEQAGQLDRAISLYRQADQLGRSKIEIRQAIQRANDHQTALADWDLRMETLSNRNAGKLAAGERN